MSKSIGELAEEQGVEPFDPDTFQPMDLTDDEVTALSAIRKGDKPRGPVKEMQDVLLEGLKKDLVEKGWTLVRDNKDGGALVLTGDGIRVVASIHTYEEKDLPPVQAEAAEEAPCSTATPAETPEDGPPAPSPAPEDDVKSAST